MTHYTYTQEQVHKQLRQQQMKEVQDYRLAQEALKYARRNTSRTSVRSTLVAWLTRMAHTLSVQRKARAQQRLQLQ